LSRDKLLAHDCLRNLPVGLNRMPSEVGFYVELEFNVEWVHFEPSGRLGMN
jgi:hypothetical protein